MGNEDYLSESQIKKVISADKQEKPKNLTYQESFIYDLESLSELDIEGFREVAIPIPLESIKKDRKTRAFIKQMGYISRNERFKLPISIEEMDSYGVPLMLIVAEYTNNTNLEAVREYLS